MQDCRDLYVDPEEDEVFFGSISEKERNFFDSNTPLKDDIELKTFLNDKACKELKMEDDNQSFNVNNEKNKMIDEGSTCIDVEVSKKELSNSFDKDEDFCRLYSNNTSVELDHSYSTPMKQKIDKSILETPKSVVKADKDGGFLQVLSEIALVKAKAEAEADKKIEDEDKENKIMSIPEIKITEPSPEKEKVLSPPKSVNSRLRRFRIIYNSPLNSENVAVKQSIKSKSFTESLESSKNFKNKYIDGDFNKSDVKKSQNNSMDLIDLNEMGENKLFINKKECAAENAKIIPLVEVGVESNQNEKHHEEIVNEGVQESENSDNQITANLLNISEDESNSEIQETVIERKTEDLLESDLKTVTNEVTEQCDAVKPTKGELSLKVDKETVSQLTEETQEAIKEAVESSKPPQLPLRFSKEARKIVEVINKAIIDDTFNFTIPEIDVDNLENSFMAPELPVTPLDETVKLNEKVNPKVSKIVVSKEDNLQKQTKTVEKDRHKMTPALSQSKIPPIKYFSDRRNQIQQGTEAKKCVKKLIMGEKRKVPLEEKSKVGQTKEKDSNGVCSSKIPVFGVKASRIRFSGRVATKTTPRTTPSGKTYKNPKFNNIESPINAYINNKPTSLIVNVKPEVKKDALTKVCKTQTVGSAKKNIEKTIKVEAPKKPEIGLPFVEYRSATPYKVEKRPESRLPRLAPSVQKLIGSYSPRVIKHEGRFYLKTPRKQNSNSDSTILADPNEVSVIVSQVAQKSNTIK